MIAKFYISRFLSVLMALMIPLSLFSQIFYKVEGMGLKTPSYIFGTHHLAPVAMLDSMPQVGEALSNSSFVVGEIVMADAAESAAVLQQYMMAPADSTLTSLYSADEFAHLNEEFKKWSGGLDLLYFNNLKPLVANMTVSLSMVTEDMPGFNPGDQLDTYFQTVAAATGKGVRALETVEEQSQFLFGSVSIADQAKALKEQLDNPAKAMDEARRLNECYFSRDIERLLAESVAESENPEFFEAILYQRNANWISLLPAIFDDGGAFVAVGALHLAGPRGVIAGLRSKGYTVTPIL